MTHCPDCGELDPPGLVLTHEADGCFADSVDGSQLTLTTVRRSDLFDLYPVQLCTRVLLSRKTWIPQTHLRSMTHVFLVGNIFQIRMSIMRLNPVLMVYLQSLRTRAKKDHRNERMNSLAEAFPGACQTHGRVAVWIWGTSQDSIVANSAQRRDAIPIFPARDWPPLLRKTRLFLHREDSLLGVVQPDAPSVAAAFIVPEGASS